MTTPCPATSADDSGLSADQYASTSVSVNVGMPGFDGAEAVSVSTVALGPWPTRTSLWRATASVACVPKVASNGSAWPWPMWSLVLLSPYVSSIAHTSRPSWYGKRSTQSGLVMRLLNWYGPVC